MNFEDFLEKKMNDFKINLDTQMKSRNKYNYDNDSYNKTASQINKINREFNDTNNNSIEKEERIKKVTLSDFSRETFENSMNFYRTTDSGSPKADRHQTKGFVYKDQTGEIAAKLIVEKKNNIGYITDIFVAPKYMGFGLYNELIKLAKNNFGTCGAIIPYDDNFKMVLFKNNNFYVTNKIKNKYILVCKESHVPSRGNNNGNLNNNQTFTRQYKTVSGMSSNSSTNNNLNNNDRNLSISNMSMKQSRFKKLVDKDPDKNGFVDDTDGTEIQPKSGFIYR